MSDSNIVVMYGKDNEVPYEIRCQALENPKIGLGMSEGTTSKPNEDCLGISVWKNDILMALADGHWGRGASELAIQKATRIFRSLDVPPTDEKIRERFYNLFEQVESELFEKAKETPGVLAPETTLIVCHLEELLSEKYLYWSSFGDSFLFVFRSGELIQLNSLHANWLGMLSRFSELVLNGLFGELGYIGVADGLETGIEKLKPGDMIFLCTDGLIGSDEEVPESVSQQIQAILHDPVLVERKIRQLIQSALDRGEKDNVSCILAQLD
jgi:serine/threonine protein phosphatase PrpC